MIPYKDDNPTYSYPFVTVGLIVLNCLVFFWELLTPMDGDQIAFSYGAIPHNLLTSGGVQSVPPVLSVFTSMFLHGGFLHIAGNMLYLWIFGDNIEDTLGHVRFFFFYLFSGVSAAYGYALMDPGSTIPMIGASGAISGVLGAYLLLFPRARVHTLIFIGIFWQIVAIPAVIVIGFWIVIQVVNALFSSGALQHGGVAWFAHVGGFLAGLFTIKLWHPRRRYS
ncbi:MAG TPA: rhomboid family intramembrane serine protease [Dissulfurispiraceae bacterium]